MAYLRACLERVRGQRIWSPDHVAPTEVEPVVTPRRRSAISEMVMRARDAEATSPWTLIDRAMVENFALVMHVSEADGVTPDTAHGLLILSLVPEMAHAAALRIEGARKGINIGFEQVTFLTPVPVNTRVRARFVLANMTEPEAGFVRVIYDVTIESEHEAKPAAVARWIVGY